MTIRLAIHIINQAQIKLRNNKNKMEQFTRHFPKNSEHTVKNAARIVTHLVNAKLKGLLALIATQRYV